MEKQVKAVHVEENEGWKTCESQNPMREKMQEIVKKQFRGILF